MHPVACTILYVCIALQVGGSEAGPLVSLRNITVVSMMSCAGKKWSQLIFLVLLLLQLR